MNHFRIQGNFRVVFTLIAVSGLASPGIGVCQDGSFPEPIVAPVISYSPFAVGGSARKALPALDCLRCAGPTACVPCGTHHGFLYYGTNPWDDDCKNGFHDCVDGECGHLAAGVSRGWMHLRRQCKWSLPWSQRGRCGCSPGGSTDCDHEKR